MGQLEKYGLYVLCLVIFLILGVAIWGGDPASPPGSNKDPLKLAASTDSGRGGDQGKAGESPKSKEAQPAPKSEPTKDGHGAPDVTVFIDPVLPKKSGEKPVKGDAAKPEAKKLEGEPAPAGGKKEEQKVEDGPRTHVVQHGDNLHDIAIKHLGSATRVQEILDLNPGIDPRRLRDGSKIKLPPAKAALQKGASAADGKKADAAATDAKTVGDKAVAKPVAAASKPAAGQPYKVRHGDTLSSISRTVYGSERHVKDILAANRGKLSSANKLRENMTLSLPAAQPAGR